MSIVTCEHCGNFIDSDNFPHCFVDEPGGSTSVICDSCQEAAYTRHQERKPLSIVDALTGNVPAVKQLRWQFTCPQCGRDNGMTNQPPLRARCISLGCDAVIEAEENPEYVAPVSRMTLQMAM